MAVSAPLQIRNKAHGSISMVADTEQGMLTLYPRQHFRSGVAHLVLLNLVVSPSKAHCPRRHSDLQNDQDPRRLDHCVVSKCHCVTCRKNRTSFRFPFWFQLHFIHHVAYPLQTNVHPHAVLNEHS